MKVRQAANEQRRWNRRFRAYPPAGLILAAVLAILLAAALFTTAPSQANGPPDLGAAFNLPFKLEQGRPPPARSYVGPRQAPTPAASATPTPTVEPPGGPPGTPTARAYPVGFSVIEIEWDQPDGNVDGFEVQVSSDGGGTWRLLAGKSSLTDPAGRLYTWTQQYRLQGHQTRHYRVRAGNGDDWSDWSDAVSATTYSTSEPDLSVEALGKNDLKISWKMPSAAATVTGWRLEVSEDAPARQYISFVLPVASPGGYLVRQPPYDSKQGWTRLATLAAADRSYTHSGLEAGDTRYYRIRADTDVGTPSWSGGRDQATTLITSLPAAPSLTAQENGATEILLTWTKPADRGFAITGYELQDSMDGNEWRDLDPASADQTSATIDIRERGLARYYRIRARNAEGLGPWSRSASTTPERVKPTAPEGLIVVDAGTTWVELTWSAAEEGDLPITGYQLQSSKENDAGERMDWKNVGSTGPSKLTFRDTGLQPGTFYTYQVAARDREGLGPWSLAPYGRKARTIAVPPAAPTLTAQAGERDNGKHISASHRYQVWIELDWPDPGRRNGGVRDFYYQVQWSPNGRDDWRDENPLSPVGNARGEDHEVGYGETRYYRVRANNRLSGADYGPWSNVAKATTRANVPSKLPSMSAEVEDLYHIRINWNEPGSDGGRAITGYEVQVSTEGYRDDSGYSTVARPSASATDYTHRGLEPDTEYCYRIRAKNSIGWSEWKWGSDQCFRTKKPAPAAPAITVAENDDTAGVVVSWPEPDTRGLTISGYSVGISSNDEDWILLTDDSGRSVTYTYEYIRELLDFDSALTDAYFRVRATSTNGGVSDWSEAVSIAIP